MHEDIKKYADDGNIKGLKYSFSNSLDVDPTFEKYRDDFEYCKKGKNVFEKHRELTKFESHPSNFDDNYWVKLKKDLFENFSQERLEHMIEVAKVIYKDKIKRLIEERQRPKEEEPKYTTITSEPTEEEKAIEQQEIERLRQKQIEEAKRKLDKENESNNKSKTKTDEKKGKTDSQSLKPSNNEGNIAGSKPTQQTSHSKKEQKSKPNSSLPKTPEEQREEAQKKLNEENKVTQQIINGEKENRKTLKQVGEDTKDIAENDLENCAKKVIKIVKNGVYIIQNNS